MDAKPASSRETMTCKVVCLFVSPVWTRWDQEGATVVQGVGTTVEGVITRVQAMRYTMRTSPRNILKTKGGLGSG